jgi:hypothetical protein
MSFNRTWKLVPAFDADAPGDRMTATFRELVGNLVPEPTRGQITS